MKANDQHHIRSTLVSTLLWLPLAQSGNLKVQRRRGQNIQSWGQYTSMYYVMSQIRSQRVSSLGMAMRLQQMRNDVDKVHIRASIREYSGIYADMRDLHRCASEKSGAWPSLVFMHRRRRRTHFVTTLSCWVAHVVVVTQVGITEQRGLIRHMK